MAKKSSNPPRKPQKGAGKHSAKASAPSRRYSLEDILNEYRDAPAPAQEEEAPQEKPSKGAHASSASRPLSADIRAFAQEQRAERAKEQEEKEKEKEKEENSASEYPSSGEQTPPEGKTPEEGKAEAPESAATPRQEYKIGGSGKGPFHRLYGYLLGQYAALSIRKRMRADSEEREREALPELSPLDAARVYASQSPAFFARSRSAALVSLLCVWIALAWGADIPIPGALGEDIRTATLVSLITLLTVMLMGLDVLTVGVFSAIGGKPGWETLLSVACLGSLLDCLYVILSKNSAAALPPCAACCVAVTLSLRGSWYRCRALKAGFLTLHKNSSACSVNEETLEGRREKYVCKSHRSLKGFIRRSEENDICEEAGQSFSLYILVACLLLAMVFAVFGKDISRLPHVFAVLTAFSGCSPALFALSMLMVSSAERLGKTGCAVAGWRGIEELGNCDRLIVTDSDLFPEGTTAFTSILISDGQDTEKVISCAGSLVNAAQSDLSRLFADLMERSGGQLRAVSAFEGSRGGARGLIDGVDVLIGNSGYMYYHGIKLDPKVVGENRIYAAFDGELVGAFGVEYTADPRVRTALHTLNKSGKKPYFAVKDFNVDAQLVERLFRCKSDNFEFPEEHSESLSIVEDEEEKNVSAIIGAGGLDRLVDLFESSRALSRYGKILKILSLVSVALGLLLAFRFSLAGQWSAISATRVLLYQLFWLLPAIAMSMDSRL